VRYASSVSIDACVAFKVPFDFVSAWSSDERLIGSTEQDTCLVGYMFAQGLGSLGVALRRALDFILVLGGGC
jgi:hypothetical protein